MLKKQNELLKGEISTSFFIFLEVPASIISILLTIFAGTQVLDGQHNVTLRVTLQNLLPAVEF